MRGFDGRVLICGSRDFGVVINPDTGKKEYDHGSVEFNILETFLQGLYFEWDLFRGVSHVSPFVVIEGGAWGADGIAAWWAENSPMHESPGVIDEDWGVPHLLHEQYPARWDLHKKAAGPIRNKQMLVEGKPTLVVAFSVDFANSVGTNDMIKQATKAGVPVIKVEIPRPPTPPESMDNMSLFDI